MKNFIVIPCIENSWNQRWYFVFQIFDSWNDDVLDSYLIKITADILRFKDLDGQTLLPKILDTAGQVRIVFLYFIRVVFTCFSTVQFSERYRQMDKFHSFRPWYSSYADR